MRKTKILAFALAVIMVFSMVSVSAFAAPSYDDIKNSAGEGNVIYYTDFEGLVLDSTGDLTEQFKPVKSGLTEKTTSNFGYITIYDQYGKEGYGQNLSSDGHSIVFSEWVDAFDRTTECPSGAGNDNNNCYDIYPVQTEAARGKDIVFSTSFTMLAESVGGTINWYVYCNHATSQIKSNPIAISGGVLKMGGKDILLLSKDVTVDIAYAIRIVAPTEPGTYNAADFDGAGKLSLADFEKKYGTVRYDAYVNGIKVVDNALFVSQKDQARIATKDRGNFNTAEKLETNKEYITGLATDYKITYMRNANVGGSTKGDTAEYDGEKLFKYDNIAVYISSTAAPEIVNSGNTVEGYDLTLGSNLELNYYMNLLPDVKADANAKVVFTIGEEVVAEKKVSEVTPDAKGIYKFTCPVNSTQMATDIKMSIVSGERKFNIFNNGASSFEHTYKVVDYAKTVLAGEFSAETKTLVKAMLNYGAYAQTYFAEKNDAIAGTLANANCAYTEVELNAANFGTGTVITDLTGIKATLVLDTDTKIKIYQGETLLGTSEGITADKLDEAVTVECGEKDVTVSVLTLAGKVPAEKTNFKNLAKALALYSQATEAYKAAQ